METSDNDYKSNKKINPNAEFTYQNDDIDTING